MKLPFTDTLRVDRYAPALEPFRFVGVDLTNADFWMQVRLTANAPGSPLLSFVKANSGVGLKLLPLDTVRGLTRSSIALTFDPAAVSALPFAARRSDDLVLFSDLHIQPAGGIRQVWRRGPIIVSGGATQ